MNRSLMIVATLVAILFSGGATGQLAEAPAGDLRHVLADAEPPPVADPLPVDPDPDPGEGHGGMTCCFGQ